MSESMSEYGIPGAVELVATGEPPIKLTVERNSRGWTFGATVRGNTVAEGLALLDAAMDGLQQRYEEQPE